MSRRVPVQRILLLALAVLLLVVGLVALVAPSRAGIADRACRFDAHICRAAERLEVDPALVAAVIAVESKGEVRARSRVGALGLMQVMPATGREMAGRLGVRIGDDEDIYEPEVNILLGTAYLKLQLDAFDGNERLALAAYNAGPRRVRDWVRAHPELGAEAALEREGYPVTRAYVANVLAYRDLIAEMQAERKRSR